MSEECFCLKPNRSCSRPGQLLKWIGNKYSSAPEIIKYAPPKFDTYYDPFLGAGGVLGTLNPAKAVAGDTLTPLIELWKLVQNKPNTVIDYYREKVQEMKQREKKEVYEEIRENYNRNPDPLKLLMISRTCYGGVVRFTKKGKISTPVGPHNPGKIPTFEKIVWAWRDIVQGVQFYNQSFEKTLANVDENDLVYLDPPYMLCQKILYGAQDFTLKKLWKKIKQCYDIGAYIMLSIDGSKKSGGVRVDIELPENIFKREILIDKGSSMLRRFQKGGEKMIGENVKDRLLLSW